MFILVVPFSKPNREPPLIESDFVQAVRQNTVPFSSRISRVMPRLPLGDLALLFTDGPAASNLGCFLKRQRPRTSRVTPDVFGHCFDSSALLERERHHDKSQSSEGSAEQNVHFGVRTGMAHGINQHIAAQAEKQSRHCDPQQSIGSHFCYRCQVRFAH